jgi:hypothetical protein
MIGNKEIIKQAAAKRRGTKKMSASCMFKTEGYKRWKALTREDQKYWIEQASTTSYRRKDLLTGKFKSYSPPSAAMSLSPSSSAGASSSASAAASSWSPSAASSTPSAAGSSTPSATASSTPSATSPSSRKRKQVDRSAESLGLAVLQHLRDNPEPKSAVPIHTMIQDMCTPTKGHTRSRLLKRHGFSARLSRSLLRQKQLGKSKRGRPTGTKKIQDSVLSSALQAHSTPSSIYSLRLKTNMRVLSGTKQSIFKADPSLHTTMGRTSFYQKTRKARLGFCTAARSTDVCSLCRAYDLAFKPKTNSLLKECMAAVQVYIPHYFLCWEEKNDELSWAQVMTFVQYLQDHKTKCIPMRSILTPSGEVVLQKTEAEVVDSLEQPLKELKAYMIHFQLRDHQRAEFDKLRKSPVASTLYLIFDYKDLIFS